MFFHNTVIFSILVYEQIIQNVRSYSNEAGIVYICTLGMRLGEAV